MPITCLVCLARMRPKTKLMEDLKLLNVTREVLLPSVDESARAVTKMRD